MKIVVISDTHGKNRNAEKVILRERPFDILFHLGDIEGGEEKICRTAGVPCYIVAGNCDIWSSLPEVITVTLEGVTFLLTHGHHLGVSSGSFRKLRTLAGENGCTVALFGHTHCPAEDLSDPRLMILNPGSVSLPRQYGNRPSYMVLTVENGVCTPRLSYLS